MGGRTGWRVQVETLPHPTEGGIMHSLVDSLGPQHSTLEVSFPSPQEFHPPVRSRRPVSGPQGAWPHWCHVAGSSACPDCRRMSPCRLTRRSGSESARPNGRGVRGGPSPRCVAHGISDGFERASRGDAGINSAVRVLTAGSTTLLSGSITYHAPRQRVGADGASVVITWDLARYCDGRVQPGPT